MLRKFSALFLLILTVNVCSAQQEDSLSIDTTFIDYEELFSELDALLDSLSTPRSFLLVNLGIGQRFLLAESTNSSSDAAKKRINYSPSISYFHRSGFGLTAATSLINDAGLAAYQYSVSGSYDYQQPQRFITGVSFTHYFTKENLSFYTSPLQNEIYGYFTYRKLWLKPSVGISYGWGEREHSEEVEQRVQNINLVRRGFTRINTSEKTVDLNILASVRHDFYFLKLFSSDYIRLTPQLSFVSGSQQFGFNQTTNSYATVRRSGRNVLYYSDQQSFDDQFYFQPISVTGFLKAEYAKGKFYVQPQMMFDYYFPTSADHFSTAFFINTGLIF